MRKQIEVITVIAINNSDNLVDSTYAFPWEKGNSSQRERAVKRAENKFCELAEIDEDYEYKQGTLDDGYCLTPDQSLTICLSYPFML